ncbi:molybdopterin molybdotransferase MoeA [Campylobacter cuniculorum]|uniref:molybdopterin molybdotransferase MoeA n=1 Tax=Campylobacter cuniculorum TaxID=374106 RepID=UPI0023F161F2|nr:molybdopterin molybdotransferase MoeA [Campylobacter cuniculorum]
MALMSYEKSLEILKSHLNPYEKIEKIALTQCLGRILAQEIKAPKNHPEFKTSAMDGYALKFEDQSKVLTLLGSTPAGTMPQFCIKEAQCVKTFTGSLMSEGSDTLVPVENVEIKGNQICVKEAVKKGFAVREIGENYKEGEILLKKGTKLDYSEIALLAELGFFHISVFIKPVVGILSSGNEIKDLGETLENPAQIRSSNHIALANLAQKLVCKSVVFPLLKDDEKQSKKALENALESCDILITTGGVSMGDFDFLKKAVREYTIIIDKVDIKPGRHIKIASFKNKFIVALPGFPYSAMVMFNLYVREILNFWLLQKKDYICQAFLCDSYMKKTPYLEFVACNIYFENGRILANLKGKKDGSSAIINNLNHKSALMMVPKECTSLKDGDLVDIIFMP